MVVKYSMIVLPLTATAFSPVQWHCLQGSSQNVKGVFEQKNNAVRHFASTFFFRIASTCISSIVRNGYSRSHHHISVTAHGWPNLNLIDFPPGYSSVLDALVTWLRSPRELGWKYPRFHARLQAWNISVVNSCELQLRSAHQKSKTV